MPCSCCNDDASISETELNVNKAPKAILLVPQAFSYYIPSFHPSFSSHIWLTIIKLSQFLGFAARDAPVVCLDARLVMS